jgi:seryl-tRNA synthetase
VTGEFCAHELIGDMGEPQAKKYDLEIWMPYRQGYGEIASNSIMTDFQARRLKIRYRTKTGELKTCYTLNDTAIPSPRVLIGLLENHQQKDGSVKIPKVLQPLTGFKEIR